MAPLKPPSGPASLVCYRPTPSIPQILTSEVGRWLLVWVGSIVTLGRGFVVFSCFLLGSSGQRPPIEPDVRFSRIRLPEVVHRVACACR